MSTREWETRWKHDATIDVYHELVATLADEVVAYTVPTSEEFRLTLAADVVMWLLKDKGMRELLKTLLDVSA